MGVRTSRKANLFLSINLLFYVLAANATDNNTASYSCSGPFAPGIPPSGGGNFGEGEGSDSSNGPPGTNSGQQPGTCPRNALQLGVCANLLGGLLGVVVGYPPTLPCCTLLAGLVDLEAAVCLCTVIRANVLGININAQVALTRLLNVCGRTPPLGFICA